MNQAHDVPAPQRMFQMITGYWVSQLVGTIATLGVVDALGGGARTVEELAQACSAHPGALARVLRTATSLGLFEQVGPSSFRATALGQTLGSGPGSMRGMAIAETAPGHWLPWGRFPDAVRTGERQTLPTLGQEIWDYYGKHAAEGAAFSEAMSDLSNLVAREVAEHLDARGLTRAVDVGGANGTLLAAVLKKNEKLSGVLLDLPHVVPGARAALEAAGLGGRIEVVAGDFFAGVPEGDLYLLKSVLHDWDDAQCKSILGHAARALRPGGRVVIVEMIVPDEPRPSLAALMDLNMLTMLPGRERTLREYEALLASVGLKVRRVASTHSPFDILEAERA